MPVLLLSGCGEPPLEPDLDQLRRNRARWASLELTTDAFTYDPSCFCAAAALTPVRVRVVDADVVEAVTIEDGEPVEPSRSGFGHSLTIEGLFGFIECSLLERPVDIDVRYDAEFGFPTSVFLDLDAGVSDDDVTISVRGFAASMLPATAELLTAAVPPPW